MTAPEPPQGIRMTLPDGTQIPLTATYDRQEDGLHYWTATLTDADDAVKVWACTSPAGIKVTADIMPGHTAIQVEVPPAPPGTYLLARGSYIDDRGKRHRIAPHRPRHR